MKNTEKNSQKSNLFFYLSIFSLSLLLIFGGIYLYYTGEERKLAETLNWIKDEKNVEYKELDNNSIVSHNERNIIDKKCIAKELKHDVNLKPKTRTKFNQVLKEIDQEIDQETLEKKEDQEREKIIRKILITRRQLGRLKISIEKLKGKEVNVNNYLKEQDEWLRKFYPLGFRKDLSESEQSEEDKEIRKELNKCIKAFFKNFIREENLSKPAKIQLARTDEGEELPFKTTEAEIARITSEAKSKFPDLDFDAKMRVEFLGFAGWHGEEKKEEGTTTAGLTFYTEPKPLKEDSRFEECKSREISITLHKNLPFSRKGKDYNLWLIRKNEETSSFHVGWNNLIETIAHELAHAVINYSKVYYRGKNEEMGGHGIIHRKYTEKIKKMIKKMPEYRELKEFWFSEK